MVVTTLLFPLILLAIVLAAFVWWLLKLIEALKTPTQQWEASGQSQLVYILLMVFLGVIGTAVYVLVAQPQLRTVGAGEQ